MMRGAEEEEEEKNTKQKKDAKRDTKKNAQTQKYYCPAETCSLKKISASSNSDALFLSRFGSIVGEVTKNLLHFIMVRNLLYYA